MNLYRPAQPVKALLRDEARNGEQDTPSNVSRDTCEK
jgi:hypothetical protein